MKRTAILNVNSFSNHYKNHISELEMNVGETIRYSVDENINGKDLSEIIGQVDYIIMGTTPTLGKDFFDSQQNLKLVTRHGIGYNHIDIDEAKKRNIFVCKEPGEVERDAVAEQAVSLLTACSKHIISADSMVRNKEWKVNRTRLMGFQLTGKTTGIIGFGHIGSRFAEIMKFGFKNRVLVYDPYIDDKLILNAGCLPVSLDDLLQKSDFVSLHCNLTDDNKLMMGKKNLRLMKSDSILINTARGGLIDEKELVLCLKDGVIKSFGADVMTQEPIEINHPILDCPNTVFSPHVGVYNEKCIYNMDRKVMNDIYLVEKGKKPLNIIGSDSND